MLQKGHIDCKRKACLTPSLEARLGVKPAYSDDDVGDSLAELSIVLLEPDGSGGAVYLIPVHMLQHL